MKILGVVGLALTVAGCQPIPAGGAGSTADGEPVVGEIIADMMAQEASLFIRSPSGWTCSSRFEDKPDEGSSRNATVPLSCSDGRTGTAIISIDEIARRITVAFAVSGGRTGTLVIG